MMGKCIKKTNRTNKIIKMKKMKNSYKLGLLTMLFLSSCDSVKKTIEYEKLSAPQVTASAKELVRITSDVVAEFQPALSPDGEKLLYAIRDDAKSGNKRFSIRLKNDIMKPGFTPLISDGTDGASWMNDKGDIIFTYWASKPVIVTSNIEKLGITYVGQNAFGDNDGYPKISPDGEKIVLTTVLQGTNSICLVKKDGSNFTVLSSGSSPAWSPDGKKIMYTKPSGDYTQIFVLDLETYQSTQITTGEYSSSYGSYSPDGKYICFISDKDDSYNHIFVMDAKTRGVSQLTSGNSTEIQPFWGVDGYIYFSSNAGARTPENTVINPKALLYADIWRVKPLLN
jgi:TolB protein